jgi:hypothetical protein
MAGDEPNTTNYSDYFFRPDGKLRKRIAAIKDAKAADAKKSWLSWSQALHAAVFALLGVNWQRASDGEVARIGRWLRGNVPTDERSGHHFVDAAVLREALRKELEPAIDRSQWSPLKLARGSATAAMGINIDDQIDAPKVPHANAKAASAALPSASRGGMKEFVERHIADERAAGRRPAKCRLEAAWQSAGRKGNREPLRSEFDRVMGDAAPRRGRPNKSQE